MIPRPTPPHVPQSLDVSEKSDFRYFCTLIEAGLARTGRGPAVRVQLQTLPSFPVQRAIRERYVSAGWSSVTFVTEGFASFAEFSALRPHAMEVRTR